MSRVVFAEAWRSRYWTTFMSAPEAMKGSVEMAQVVEAESGRQTDPLPRLAHVPVDVPRSKLRIVPAIRRNVFDI